VRNAVPTALLTEATKIAEVLSNLSGSYLEQLAELLRTDDIDAAALKLSKSPKVAWESINDDFWNSIIGSQGRLSNAYSKRL
jgi:hypothetical protein